MKTPIGQILVCLVPCLVVLTHAVWAQTTGPSALQQISVEGSDTYAVVTLVLEGDRVLPGALEEIATPPFRLFIDLPNVIPHVEAETRVERGGVDRVRVALTQSSPPVTRVVLDLSRRSTYRLEQDTKSHVLRIIVGTPGSTESPDTTKGISADVAGYARWFERSAGKVDRLLSAATAGDVAVWEGLWNGVAAVAPPPLLQVAHDLLATAVTLGAIAARDGDHVGPRSPEAESANAGARLFMARARALVRDHLAGPVGAQGER